MKRHRRILVFKDDGIFVAQAPEIDISAQGETEIEALQWLMVAIALETDFANKPHAIPAASVHPQGALEAS